MLTDPQTKQRVDRLRFLTFNIQAGTTTVNYRDYVTKSWKHVMPHSERSANLASIAELISEYDIVGLQELDNGSFRSGFLNQSQYLAEKARFPYWSTQANRKVGKIAASSNALLSRFLPDEVHDHKLPGRIAGRGALIARYGKGDDALHVIVSHLSLGKRSRAVQLEYLTELIGDKRHVVMMGDLNAQSDTPEIRDFLDASGLTPAVCDSHTFPSWNPQRSIDFILTSPSLKAIDVDVINIDLSDHLPVATTIMRCD